MEKLDPLDHAIDFHLSHSRNPNPIPRKVIPLGFSSIEFAREQVELYDFSPHELPTDDKISTIQKNVSSFIDSKSRLAESPLRPHQRNVFEDLARFIDNVNSDERTGYVRIPTATGKTVIFVELCKALLGDQDSPENPRILVVTPTKDLVNQTVGTNVEKGFARFAPQIRTTPYYSDTATTVGNPKSKQVRESQVCITTYSSFGQMFTDQERSGVGLYYQTNDERRPGQTWVKNNFYFPPTGRNIIDMFDVIIFDEAHNTLGPATRRRVESLVDQGKICIGFTATSNYSKSKNLSELLKHEIHTMDPAEAIAENLLAPIMPLTIMSGKKVGEKGLLNFAGDYAEEKLDFLGHDKSRNEIIVRTAATLIENGIMPIISCIAGKDKFHPKHIAELLGGVEITDFFTGRKHRIRAVAIDSDMPTKERLIHYQAFERGGLDALCFIDILTEGWDSQRAKALINARPTRSRVFAQQRLGRVLRLSDEHSPVSFAVDILDEFKDYPPVLTADLLYGETIHAGEVIGETGDYDQAFIDAFTKQVMAELGSKNEIAPVTNPLFSEYETLVASYPASREFMEVEEVDKHGIRAPKEYATVKYMDSEDIVPYLTPEILERLQDSFGSLESKVTRRGYQLQTLYRVDDVVEAVGQLPEINPETAYIDTDKKRWLTAAGFKILLQKHFPRATVEDMRVTLESMERAGIIGYVPMLARYDHRKNNARVVYGCLKLYREETYKTLARELEKQMPRRMPRKKT